MRGFIKNLVDSGNYRNVRRDREKLTEEQELLSLLRQPEQSGLSRSNVPELMKSVKL
ncbi:MAG: hypothetical protein K8F52_17670 [Candidatus Scalindua rubra]|nr:hypothetical protein [Candidatus Scalindua rubra]TWU36319.1 hypothetical protein S225a_05980 [Candidatus Brocadiaceae bacterium S225]